MLDIKVRMEDLEDIEYIYADFEKELSNTASTLEEAIEYMEDELSGEYKEKFIEIFEHQIKETNNFRESAIELHNFITSIIDDINDTVDVENEQIHFEYDEEQFNKIVDTAEEQLDSSSYEYKRIVQMSAGFEDWYSSEQRKLSIHIDSNQTLISQTTSSIEEGLRLHDDKKVLNHNYKVMQKLDNALQDINFDVEIEKLQEVQKKLNKLELLNEYSSLPEVPTFDPISTSIPSYDVIVSTISKEIKSSTHERIGKIIRGNKLNFEEFSDLFASLCINYDGKRFKLTSDVYGVKEAINNLRDLGYTENEAFTMFSIVNMQHANVNDFEEYLNFLYTQFYGDNGMIANGIYSSEQCDYLLDWYEKNYIYCENLFENIAPYKDVDLSHMMLAISVQLDNVPKGLILELGLNGYRDEYFSWKGDVDSGRMDTDDIKADINAFVISNMYIENNRFNIEDAQQYILDVENGTLNPVDEFLKIYGDGDIQKGYDEVISQLNDTTSGTVVINEGMKQGAVTEIIDVIPWESLKFENYFSNNQGVQNSYVEFTNYLYNNSSVNIKEPEEQIYGKHEEE